MVLRCSSENSLGFSQLALNSCPTDLVNYNLLTSKFDFVSQVFQVFLNLP